MEIIFCIPGPWSSLEDLRQSFRNKIAFDAGYLFENALLVDIGERKSFNVDLQQYDEKVLEIFLRQATVAGLSDDDLDEIGNHRSVVYLISEGGAPKAAEAALRAVNVVLECGGAAVKVETSGKVLSKETVSSILSAPQIDLVHTYVFWAIGSEKTGEYISCGMHNFGFRDVVVQVSDGEVAYRVIGSFLYYMFQSNPRIQSGQTISIKRDSDPFLIEERTTQPYADHEFFKNPYGMWQLSPVAKT